MSNSTEIRELAIKRHDLDADFFQSVYSEGKDKYSDPFLYGRYFISEEIDLILKTLKPNSAILDIGCGTGHLTNEMKKKGYQVFGMEPSEEMLNYAKKNFPDIEFKKGVSVNLPYPDNSFDFVIAIEVLRYLSHEDVFNTYKEIYRVLKKDGKMLVTHVNKYASDFYYIFYHLKGFIEKLRREVYHYCYFTTAETEIQMLKKAGFKDYSAKGRMFACIRIAYKLGILPGRIFTKLLELISKDQKHNKNPSRFFSGHLFVYGEK